MGQEGTLSLRESLEEAFDEVEEATSEGEQEEVEEVEEVAKATEVEPEPEVEEASKDEEKLEEQAEEEQEAEPDTEAEAITEAIKAPNSWKPVGKEVWKDVPEAARTEIKRRESEMGRLMNDSSHNKKTAESYTQVVQPFLNNIQAEGVTPQAAITNLLQTAASLQMGSSLVKAQTITRLIGAYGVDIQTLSDILTDTYKPTEEDRINQAVDERMAPYNQQQAQYQQQSQYEEQQTRESIHAETDAWSESAEFIKEVGPDMADLLEIASKRGSELTLDDAYDKACQMNTEIRKIINQREAAARAKETNKSARKKKRAGSSIVGSSAGKPGAMQDTSLRGALEAAWDDADIH